MNRTMEFILQTQASLSARMDRREEQWEKELAESKRIQQRLAGLTERVIDMIASQAERIDRFDEWKIQSDRRYEAAQKRNDEYERRNIEFQRRNDEYQKRNEEYQRHNEEFQKEALDLLRLLLDRLTRPPNPNLN